MRLVIRTFIWTLLISLFVFTYANAAVQSDSSKQLSVSQPIWCEEQSLEKVQETKQTASSLPAALQMIDDSAFEGTALISVAIPESVTYIGDHAFANIPTLLWIRIPDSTHFIGKDTFAGSQQVILTASNKSYARTWAVKNSIPFAPMTVFCASDGIVHIQGMYLGKIARDKLTSDETIETPKCSDSKGRTNGEILAAKHEECFAFSLQGRSPPMKG